MSRVDGLGGRNSTRSRKDSRAVTRRATSKAVGLAPSAAPTGAFINAPQVNADYSDTQRLIGALSSLNGSIGKLAQVHDDKQRKAAEVEAQRRINEMTFEEAKAAVESGQLPASENPYFKRAFSRLYGTRLGLHRANELAVEYENSFDKRNGDIESLIANHAEADLEDFTDEFIVSGYNSAFTQAATRLRQTHSAELSKIVRQDTIDGVYEVWMGEVREGLANGLSSDQIYQNIRSHYRGNREILNLTYKEQDTVVVQLAEALAEEGHVDLVEQLVMDDRGGTGAIAKKRGAVGASANRAYLRAKQVSNDLTRERTFDTRMGFWDQSYDGTLDRDELIAFHKQNKGAFTDSQVQSLIARNEAVLEQRRKEAAGAGNRLALQNQADLHLENLLMRGLELGDNGRLAYVTDVPVLKVSGDGLTEDQMTGDKYRDAVRDTYLKRVSPLKAAKNQETPEQTMQREIGWLSVNGLSNPQWESILAAGYSAASTTTAESPEIAPAMVDGLNIYRSLRESGPGAVKAHIKDQATRDFYSVATAAMEELRLSEDRALSLAVQATRNPEFADAQSLRQRYQDIHTKASTLNGWGDGRSEIKNMSSITPKIEKIAQIYARIGLPTDKALERATAQIDQDYVQINGWMIPQTDHRLPADFKPRVETYLQRLADQYGDELDVDYEDLTVTPVGNLRWSVVDANSGFGIPIRDKRYFTLQDLLEMDAEIMEEKAEALSEENAELSRRRREVGEKIINNPPNFGW